MFREKYWKDHRSYKAFLIRLWLTSEAGISTWRASVEDAGTGRKIYFASLSALFTYLLDETRVVNDIEECSIVDRNIDRINRDKRTNKV